MALSQSKLERAEGDLLSRRRKVDRLLNGERDTIEFGPLSVGWHPAEGMVAARSPDGDLYEIQHDHLDDPERIEHVEAQLRRYWEEWLDAL